MIGAVVQARTGSTRLPGKVLRTVLGRPLLGFLVERLRASRRVERIVVATTREPADDPIAALAAELGVACTRGSAADVLDRYLQAAREHGLDPIVRVCGDCPLIDPAVLDRVVDRYLALVPDIDYVGNVRPPTYPDGLDVEVFGADLLARVHRLAAQPYQREHVTAYVAEHPHLFRCENVASEVDLAHHRWTVDDPEDFEFVRTIIEALYPSRPAFRTADVLGLLASRPELLAVNGHLRRNAGFVRSLERQGLAAGERERIVRAVLRGPS